MIRARMMGPRGLLAALLMLLATPAAGLELTILHVNDVHSRLLPMDERGVGCTAEADAERACIGGYARLATLIAERRAAAEAAGRHVLVLDAGDQFQGSLFYTRYRGQAEAEMMRLVGFDAMALGNHEFDGGPEELGAFIDAVDFPVLAANLEAGREPALDGKVPPWALFERGGETIAVVGLVTDDTPQSSSPGPRVGFAAPTDVLRDAIAALGEQGIERIVVLGHLGIRVDVELARTVAGVDAIIGGHSHTLLSNSDPGAAGPYPLVVEGPDGRAVPVVQAGQHLRHLGELHLTFDETGRVAAFEGDTIRLDAAIPPDPAVAARIAELAEPLDALRRQVIGETTAALDGTRASCRSGECALGSVVADAVLDRTARQGVEVVLLNGGGIRASLPAGAVTTGDVLEALPFLNTVSTFRLSGADLIAALEHGLGRWDERRGSFPQVAGLRFAWDPARPAGERLIEAEVREPDGRWSPLDPGRLYGIASNDFMRRGGDGYEMLRDRAVDAYDFGPNLDEVVAAYLAANTPIEPPEPGRIRRP